MSLEEGISSWLHQTYTDASHLFTAASAVMTDPVSVNGTLYPLSLMAHDVYELAWDTTPPGFLQAFLQGLSGNSPAAFSAQWPVQNQNLTIGGYYAMTVLVIPNVYRCSIEMALGGRQVINVIGVQGSAAGQQATVAAALKTAWEAAAGPLKNLPTGVTMTGYNVMDLSTTTGGITLLASNTAGGVAVNPGTRAAAALVRWNGGSRARSTRGRLYFGPLPLSYIQTDGASMTATGLTNVGAAFTAFQASLLGSGFPLVVISRKFATATAVTSQAVEQTIGTQRRRIRS